MKKYGNKSGNSGVTLYEIGDDFIYVVFAGSSQRYKYSHTRPGIPNVNKMKLLAESGKGLSTYISRYVKNKYEKD
jgi:hypothetical protein